MDMPRGTGVGNPTAHSGLQLAFGGEPEEIGEMAAMIKAMREELAQKLITVNFVEAWLRGLTEKERWLIVEQVIEGKYWREISMCWKAKFGELLSIAMLKKLKARAKEKIYQMAG